VGITKRNEKFPCRREWNSVKHMDRKSRQSGILNLVSPPVTKGGEFAAVVPPGMSIWGGGYWSEKRKEGAKN